MNINRVIFAAVCFTGTFIGTWLLFVQMPGKDNPSEVKVKHERDVKEMPNKQWMEFDDFLDGTFRANSFYPRWVSGSEYVYKNDTGAIYKFDVDTNVATEILNGDPWTNTEKPFSWTISADQNYLAIFYMQTDGYAHYVRTFSCDIYEMSTGTKQNLPELPKENLQKFQWSASGHDFSYVYEFNIYLYKNSFLDHHQITSNGNEQMVFNGIADWLFSVEITDDDSLMWWSPDSQYLAYATIYQTDVLPFEFAVYNNYQYPEMIKFPYPKPGTPIPFTSISVLDLNTMIVTDLTTSDFSSWSDGYYLNSVTWRGNSILSPLWKNRISNEAVVENCGKPDFNCSHVSEMMSKSTTGWLGHYKVAHIIPTNNEEVYLTVRSLDGFPHISVFNVNDNKDDWRTSGDFEVTDTSSGYSPIYFYDEINDWIYFTSTELESKPSAGLPRIRHMWRVKGSGSDKTRFCITCSLNTMFMDRCNWVTPSFSVDGSHVVINCGGSGNAAPLSTLHKRNAGGDFDFVRVVEGNEDLVKTLNDYYFRERIYGNLTLPGISGEWFYMLQLPPNFDESKKYPMLVQVYSGPAYQEVEDRFGVSWKDYVSSARDVIVMSFDGRGTGFRGDEIMHQVYRKLGQYEPHDQIAAAKKLANENSFIDETRMAIWGWSYGGYATSRTIGEDVNNVFKCGFAVAPVTKWEYYHTIYTERYMQQPKDNPDGYEKSTTLQGIESFRSHHYNLFHGTRDENVHFQNSAQLSKYLIEGDVKFGAFFAADDDHSMSRVDNGYKNIYKLLTRQMEICFNL
uniref:dipeptidyl peptidase 4-like isoform X1 n=1 Tax=Ciona intestinalis TaxID=7719 RepID=UPI00089DBEB4|nr:dipeptidyl peptidase 4-like isoform X1 [Ciona intestinalis]|eukprot:XP_018666654.1 dipeptidyl peptidase 4-like isoform X1 [Ciona intestinalis]